MVGAVAIALPLAAKCYDRLNFRLKRPFYLAINEEISSDSLAVHGKIVVDVQ